MEHKNIHEALLAIYGAIGYVQKQSSSQLNYTFAGEGAFIRALRPAMIEHGVVMFTERMGELTQEIYTTSNDKKMMRSTVHCSIAFYHALSNTKQNVESFGEGSDVGDKSLNKAMTDAYKYALRQTFMIETGDDPDNSASEEREGMTEVAKKEMGAKEVPVKSGMPLEEAVLVSSEKDGLYADMDIATLSVRFNEMNKIKKNEPEKFTNTHSTKMAAIKTLIAEKSKQVEA